MRRPAKLWLYVLFALLLASQGLAAIGIKQVHEPVKTAQVEFSNGNEWEQVMERTATRINATTWNVSIGFTPDVRANITLCQSRPASQRLSCYDTYAQTLGLNATILWQGIQNGTYSLYPVSTTDQKVKLGKTALDVVNGDSFLIHQTDGIKTGYLGKIGTASISMNVVNVSRNTAWTTTNINFTLPASVDINKTLVFMSFSVSGGAANNPRCYWITNQTITCERFLTASASIQLQTVEFTGDVSVSNYTGTLPAATGPTNIIIANVNTSRAIILPLGMMMNGTSGSASPFVSYHFINGTVVQINHVNTHNASYSFLVAQIEDATVQHVSTTVSSDNLTYTPITGVNVSNTFVIGTWSWTGGNAGTNQVSYNIYLENGTHVTRQKNSTQNDSTQRLQIISIPGMIVTKELISIADTQPINNKTISAVNTSRTITISGGAAFNSFTMGATAITNNNFWGVTANLAYLTNSTTLEIRKTRVVLGSGPSTNMIQVITWPVSTPSTNSCTYSSGNWLIQIADNCNITTTVNLARNNVTINGTTGAGRLYVSGALRNWSVLLFNNAGATLWGTMG